ncbi:large subunit ribosomal protein L25 [Keratinibaculum paraultunense]|uniref:Large ribosomal subunit protein bL25 n=1 Tax=Keratinibaculum paraultunense TaxID=1278232 RepID=A0A4R3KTS6_9FIRM|nr:50S ribosomal protein L25 [Keratinibaculum paraultunense]QQY79864.1 50S ribosomal protein L25 [Keratinibaculum paraultunense]TCS88749.1 large subunit ribosomal protein L25 [Keratinibaculum paraultunense]
MAAVKIQVEERTGLGKNKVDKLREKNFVPGVLYGKGEETKHIQVDRRIFEKVYKSAGMSTLIDLEFEGEVVPVLIKEVQIHPFKNEYLHVDFQKLNMDEKVKLTLPITLVGRENIKQQPSVLIQQLDEIEIECLPGDIPEDIVVDVSDIDFNTPILVSDLDIFNNENITILREADDVIASLIEPTEEIIDEEEEVLEADEVPVIGEDDVESEDEEDVEEENEEE